MASVCLLIYKLSVSPDSKSFVYFNRARIYEGEILLHIGIFNKLRSTAEKFVQHCGKPMPYGNGFYILFFVWNGRWKPHESSGGFCLFVYL